MKDTETLVGDLKIAVNEFVRERDWKKFHNPKDVAESICIEATELLQLFQWIKPEDSQKLRDVPSKLKQIKEELADIAIYCLSMANTLEIDLTTTILDKIELNKKKYPTGLYKGKAHIES